jgi:hypothetical protein
MIVTDGAGARILATVCYNTDTEDRYTFSPPFRGPLGTSTQICSLLSLPRNYTYTIESLARQVPRRVAVTALEFSNGKVTL